MPLAEAESLAVYFILLLLLTGALLIVFLWVGTLFFQGYIYTEPAEQLAWRAPAAGAALLVFYAIWCLFEANADRSAGEGGNLVIPFLYSPRELMTPEPVKHLWVVRKDAKGPVEYTLKKFTSAGMTKYEYVETKTGNRWRSSGVEDVLLEVNGEKDPFKVQKAQEGSYRVFVDKDGWTMPEFDTGPTGQPTRFRTDWFLGNLLLNLVHLAVWFVCLWLLLRFQWPHALGLAFVLWLVVSLTVLPILLTQARSFAGQTPPPRQKSAARSIAPPPVTRSPTSA